MKILRNVWDEWDGMDVRLPLGVVWFSESAHTYLAEKVIVLY